MAVTIIHAAGLEHIKVNTKAVERVLAENGKIPANLSIYIKSQQSEEHRKAHERLCEIDSSRVGTVCGQYHTGKHMIDVFINGALKAAIHNNTLLHELHHEIKNGYLPGEQKLPYRERPSEIAACAFAAEQAKRYQLISIPGEVIPISYEMVMERLLGILAIEIVVVAGLVLHYLAR